MELQRIHEFNSTASRWAVQRLNEIANRNRRRKLSFLYFIFADLVLLLGIGISDGETGIMAWLILNTLVIISLLITRALWLILE